MKNKKGLLRERKRHTARLVASARYAGGVPRPRSGRGYPVQGLGVPHPRSGGYPILGPEGYPSDPPIQTWDGIPPDQTWDGVPPTRPGMGYPFLARPGMG